MVLISGVRMYSNLVIFFSLIRNSLHKFVFTTFMRMVGAEGSGRRLPSWMLGVSASDQVEKSDDVKAKKKLVEEGLPSQASIPGPRSKKRSLCEKENLLERPHVLAKCTTKRRKLKEKPVDADSDIDVSDDVPEKKYNRTGRKVSKSVSQKRCKSKGYRSSDEKLDIQPLSEDEDVELTVEDLMTIAKEVNFELVPKSIIMFDNKPFRYFSSFIIGKIVLSL